MRYKELFESTESCDLALKKYIEDPMNSYGVRQYVDELKTKYPIVENTTVYRGLNFKTKERYDEFINNLKDNDNFYDVLSISSWSPNKSTAEDFAYSEQTYGVPSLDLLNAYSKAKKENEKMVGYRGVILTTVVDPGYGIDVRKSGFGSESEIILLKGSYKVKIEIIKSYKDKISDNETNPNEVIMATTKEESKDDTSFFKWILTNINPSELTDESKHKIFELVSYNINYGSEAFKSRFDTRTNIRIYYNTKLYDLNEKGFLLPLDASNLKKQGIEALKHFMEVAIKHPNHKIDTFSDIQYLVRFCDFENEWSDFIKMYGDEYRNRSNTVRDINKISDPKEKSKAIDDYKNDIMAILNNIVKL